MKQLPESMLKVVRSAKARLKAGKGAKKAAKEGEKAHVYESMSEGSSGGASSLPRVLRNTPLPLRSAM